MRRTKYTVETCPPYGGTAVTVLTACRIAQRYTHRIPTWQELVSEFGMHRATAYRWVSAIRQARRAAA